MRATQVALRQLGEVRVRTVRAEHEALRRGIQDISRLSATYKASVFVMLAAIFEAMFRDIGTELRLEVLARCPAPELLRPELVGIAAHGTFVAARDANRNGLLERAKIARGPTLSTDDWPEAHSFADGRTVDGKSFDAIWVTLNLPGDGMPSPNHRRALNEIKELRNRIAHGEDEAAVVGGSKTYQDVYLRVVQSEELIESLDLTLDQWLVSRGWAI